MADRTWNRIESRILDEDWSRVAILVLEQIIIKCPNQYGIYKLPLGFLKRFFDGLFADGQPSISDAINELTIGDDPPLKLYDDVVWIRKKWGKENENPSPQILKGARSWVCNNYNRVSDDFDTLYEISDTLSRKCDTLSKKQDRVCGKSDISDTESESDSESDSDIIHDMPEKLERYADLVMDILSHRKAMTEAQLKKQANDLRLLCNAYGEEEVIAVLKWGASDEEARGKWKGWKSVFKSISRLRENDCEKYENMKSAYERKFGTFKPGSKTSEEKPKEHIPLAMQPFDIEDPSTWPENQKT